VSSQRRFALWNSSNVTRRSIKPIRMGVEASELRTAVHHIEKTTTTTTDCGHMLHASPSTLISSN
jgi:hypothetical protein